MTMTDRLGVAIANAQITWTPEMRLAWEKLDHDSALLLDAARKVLRVHNNGQPKQMDDAVLLLRAALQAAGGV
jgi:hypothetical protein